MNQETKELLGKAVNSKRSDKKQMMLMAHPEHDGQPLTVELREEFRGMLDLQLANKAESWHELEERLTIVGELLRILRTKYQEDKAPKVGRIHETEIASVLNSLMYIKRVGINNDDSLPLIINNDDRLPLMVYDYDSGIYKESNRSINRMASKIDSKLLPNNKDNVRKTLYDIVQHATPTTDKNVAVLGNGLYNISTGEFSNFTPDKVYLTKASVNWNPEATCPDFDGWTFDGFLDEQFGNEEDKLMVYQILQYALLNNMAKKTFIYLYSADGRTGKGTLTELIRQLVGIANSGSANIEQLESTFGLESVYDKAFIYGNENDAVFAKSSNNIKNLAGGDALTVQRKGVVNLSVEATPLIVQSMNSTPKFLGIDGGVKNRMRILEFKHSYYGDDNEDVKDVYVRDKQFLEYLAYKVLTMPLDLIIDSENSQRIKGEMMASSDTVLAWFNERLVELEFEVLTTPVMFLDFQAYAEKQNLQSTLTSREFVNRVKQIVISGDEFVFRVQNKSIVAPDSTIDNIRDNINEAGLVLKDSMVSKTKRSSAIERL